MIANGDYCNVEMLIIIVNEGYNHVLLIMLYLLKSHCTMREWMQLSQ